MSEAQLQSNVVKYPKIKYCASLGGQYQSHISQRNKAKATGYVKGFPDLQICEARGGYFGLFIEIKQLKSYATKEQKQWIIDLNERGYKACCLKGLDSIIETIDNYIKQPPTIGIPL